MATLTKTRSPILDALDIESYQYLSIAAPDLLAAIEAEVENGKSADQIQRLVAAEIGPEREALARRCRQAASYIERRQRG
jgi:type II secretory pathway component PulF